MSLLSSRPCARPRADPRGQTRPQSEPRLCHAHLADPSWRQRLSPLLLHLLLHGLQRLHVLLLHGLRLFLDIGVQEGFERKQLVIALAADLQLIGTLLLFEAGFQEGLERSQLVLMLQVVLFDLALQLLDLVLILGRHVCFLKAELVLQLFLFGSHLEVEVLLHEEFQLTLLVAPIIPGAAAFALAVLPALLLF